MAQLDPFRADILMLLQQGQSQVAIMRALKERYGIQVKRSTISDYVKTLGEGEPIMGPNGAMPGMPMMSANSEDVLTTALMRGAGEEILNRLAQLTEAMQQLKQEGEETARRVQDALERHTRAFNALYGTFRGAALGRIWLRAALVTGTLWGGGLAAFYVYRWGLPFWAYRLW